MLVLAGGFLEFCKECTRRQCTVRVCDRFTDWIRSRSRLIQGYSVSPILFSILIDDLAKETIHLMYVWKYAVPY